MKILAPIVLFTYNRLEHTKKTIKSLQKNYLAEKSELFIYSDGGKNKESWKEVSKIREYLKTISGFKHITILEQEKNIGLASSIIIGVTKIVNKYGKIIVLEDDIVTSPYFLSFMNDALNFYEDKQKVWHISGWAYPLTDPIKDETFLWRVMNCWGWATWKNRWQHYEKNPKKLIKEFNKDKIHKFNLDGKHNFWSQVLDNNENRINTWAIFWYATIFSKNGLCVNPSKSFTENIGFDEKGTHTKVIKNFKEVITTEYPIKFEKEDIENKYYLNKIKEFYVKNSTYKRNDFLNFNKTLAAIFSKLDTLKDAENEYIIYGAGTGAKLILNCMEEKICYIIDKNKEISIFHNKKVFDLSKLNQSKNKIIISVFGRENEILNLLVDNYEIDINQIILLP